MKERFNFASVNKPKSRKWFLMLMICICLLASFVLSACGSSSSEVEPSDVHSIEDLAGKKIGVQLGTTGDIYATEEEANGATIERYNKGADAISSLKLGVIDCVIIDQEPAKAFVAANTGLGILDEAYAEEEYAICISKENAELREKINSAIQELEENGTLEDIKNYYIGDNEDGVERYQSPEGVDYSNGTLVVATNAAFEPYEYIENNEYMGIDMDMIQAVGDILGMKIEIENIEFDAIITAVQSGKADVGIAGMTVTEERLKNIDFTDTYTTTTQVIVVRTEETGSAASIGEKFYDNFIKDSRYMYILTGLGTTLLITLIAIIIGIILGFLIAIARSSCDMTGKAKLLNLILKLYLTIIRGTPSMIQLLIIYYVIFASSNVNKVLIAALAFGLNSSAYIAEIVRSGIMSIDKGQFEASRSMGFTYTQTMTHFILPQAIKNVLPALGNEFIVLIKETSIAGYIGIMDLTRAGDFIRSRTYEAFLPLIAVALVYLIIVVILTSLVGKLERHLKNDVRTEKRRKNNEH